MKLFISRDVVLPFQKQIPLIGDIVALFKQVNQVRGKKDTTDILHGRGERLGMKRGSSEIFKEIRVISLKQKNRKVASTDN